MEDTNQTHTILNHPNGFFYQAIFDSTQDAMIVIDADQTLAALNRTAEAFFGYSAAEVIGSPLRQLLPEAVLVPPTDHPQKIFARRKDGVVSPVEASVGAMPGGRLVCVLRDLNVSEGVDQAGAQKTALYQTLVDQAGDALFVHNMRGRILEVNLQSCLSLGYTREELLQMNIMDLEADFSLESAQLEWVKVNPGTPFILTGHHRRKDGTIFPVEIRLGCVIWNDEKVFLGLAHDITRRQQVEEELLDTRELFHIAFEYSATGVCLTGIDGRFMVVNQAMCEMFGFSKEEFQGKLFNDVTLEEDHHVGQNLVRQMLAGEVKTASIEKRYVKWNGQPFWASVTAALVRDGRGRPRYFITQIMDITGRKVAEEAVQRHRKILQLFIEHAPAAIAMFDREMRYISVSRRFLADYEISDQDVIGRSHYEVFPEIPQRWRDIHQRCLAGAMERCEEDPFPRASGKLDWVRWEIRPWYENDGKIGGVILFSEVVTEQIDARKRNETQFHWLNSLHAIDLAIISSYDVRAVLNILIDALISSLGADAADVLLYNPVSNTLDFAVGRGFIAGRTAAAFQVRPGVGLAGQAALEGELKYIPDIDLIENSLARPWMVREEGFRAYFAAPLFVKGLLKGMLEVYHRGPLEPSAEWLSFFESMAGQAAIAIDNAQVNEGLQRANLQLSLAYDATIEGWSRAMDLRDHETENHTLRVTDLTIRLARAMGIADEELVHIRRGCLLHDIGKLGVPDNILLKPAALTEEEWVIMRRHPQLAYEMIAPIDYLRPALDIPYCHHEKWDGSGYPRGISGEQIPIAARIFAVVDVWDALSSDRPYRAAWPESRVLDYIRGQSGAHFDPLAVELFFRMKP